MANRDMVKWQSNVLSHLDDNDSDSDRESALSGSIMVDSVMNDLRKRGLRNKGEEFHLDPVAEATAEEVAESGHNFEKDMRLKHNARSTHSTQGHSQTVPRFNYQHHQLRVANGNTLVSPGKQDVWLDQHFGSHHHGNAGTGFNPASYSHPHHHMPQQPGDRTRYNLQSAGGYHGNHTSSQGSYGNRPDSRGAGSYPSSGDHISRGHSSRSQQLKDVRSGMPSAYLGSSFGTLTHLPPSATPSSPSATQEEGRKDVRQRSRSLGRSASGEDPTTYHNRSGSLPRSDGGGSRRELDLHEVVEFLQSRDSSTVVYAASYLQHLAYGDDAMKMRIRDHGAIPVLIGLLRHSERKVQLAVLGALRNLSFGRTNDTNKVTIAQDHGLLELIYQLRSSRSTEVRELVTGVLWNLSSCEHLKMNIIKAGLVDVINYILLRSSSWSPEQAANPDMKPNSISWTAELCNATGMLRNVSSAGEEARLILRSAQSLVDILLWIVRGAIGSEEANNKTVENIMCILRNLSYRIEIEVDPQEGSEETIDKGWEVQQMKEMDEERRLFEKHSNKSKRPSTFSLCTRPQTRESLAATLSAREEQLIQKTKGPAHMMMLPKRRSPLYGTPLLWQPDTVLHYVGILRDTTNAETQEAACGAIHNLTACVWKWAAYQRKMIRLCEGLPTIVSLTISESDAVTRAAVTALRNLSIDLLNKAIIGQIAMSKLICRLPFGSRNQGLTEPTVVAVLCALIELVSESTENIRSFRQAGGAVLVSRLAKSKQHPMKMVFAANKLCSLVADDREGRQALKKEQWDISMFSKLSREVGSQYDFEPRSTSKEVRGVRRGSKRRSSDRKKESSKENKRSSSVSKSHSGSGKKKSPVQSKTGVPHRSIKDLLPPTPGEEPPQQPAAEPDAGMRYYESVDSRQQRQTSVPTLQYSSVSEEEKASVIRASQDRHRSESSQPAVQQPLPPLEAASLYAAVDMDKKRAERRYAGQPRDRRPQQPQQPSKPAPAAPDSWV